MSADNAAGGCQVNRLLYAALLLSSAFFIGLGLYRRDSNVILFSTPLLVLSAVYLCRPSKWSSISPKMCILLIAMLAVSHICNMCFEDELGRPGDLIELGTFVTDMIMGLLLALVSIIGIRNMLRYAPELANGRPVFITVSQFCLSITMCELLRFATVALDAAWAPDSMMDIFELTSGLLGSIAGTAVTCGVFLFNSRIGFLGPGFDRLVSSDLPQVDQAVGRNSIKELILQGESDRLEFKSTLRTNLSDGAKDPRMETAVLKTIVAFLNTRGGTLLIGVSDSGEIIGADEQSFDSRDRMLLHLNNIIAGRIGKEFIAFINYYIVDFDGRAVIRVNCTRSESPVFLRDGKEETFYIRSGPSSIDLHGIDLLRYADHNYRKVIRARR